MMYCLCTCIILISCTPTTKNNTQKISAETSNKFVLNGSFNDSITNKVYLNKIAENYIFPIDSAVVKNNKFIFQGVVNYPERFALTFYNYGTIAIIILENSIMTIEFNVDDLGNPTIKGSPLNAALNDYKNTSKEIFNKIQYLYPYFQKARLENDVEKLAAIKIDLEKIEQEHSTYTYNFIKQHPESFVAAILLRDQLKLAPIDTVQIKEAYVLLSPEVKQSPDAQIIATTLQLH